MSVGWEVEIGERGGGRDRRREMREIIIISVFFCVDVLDCFINMK